MSSMVKNIFFIISALLVVPIWLEERHMSERLKQQIRTGAISLSALLCMTFPVQTVDGFIYDLRQVPIWIGGLYGGPMSALFLCTVAIVYRIVLGGNAGIVTTVIVSTFQVVTCFLFSRKFCTNLSPSERIVWITVASISTSVLTIIIVGSLFGYTAHVKYMFATYFPAQPIAAFIGAYITEAVRKNAELRQRIIRAEKMEVVGHLAASISHEVRNPLTVSRGFMQLLGKSETISNKDKQYIQIAIEELDRAESIITDYLTFAKPAPEHVEKLNVKTEIERVIDVLRPLANMNSIDIQTSLVSFAIKGERQKFRQCLLNVMKNAIEAMPNGGVLRVHVSVDKNHVLIHISDTGIGMTKEQIQRLGEPYFTTKGTKGTGLGMMVVYRIVETMKGDLFIHSEVGHGTHVYMYFPSYYATEEIVVSEKRNTVLL